MAIPTQIRQRIVDDCKDGITYREVAVKWRVSIGTVSNIMKGYRETGQVAPPSPSRVRKSVIEHRREEVLTFLEENKNATLNDVREKLDVPVSVVTIWRRLKNWNLSHKKNDLRKRAQQAGRREKTSAVERNKKQRKPAK